MFRGHPFIRIPEIVADRSTARVLTSAYHDGMRWAAATSTTDPQPQPLKDRWGEAIHRFAFGALYRHGMVNADPHPGNYLFHEDGAVTFLDFGCVKRFAPATMERIKDVGKAMLAEDAGAAARAMADAGFLPGPDVIPADRLYAAMRQSYLPMVEPQPWTYRPESVAAIIEANIGMTEEYRAIARDFDVPPDYVFLGRLAIGTHSVLSGLRATGMWRSMLEELWFDAEPETELGRIEQRWRTRNTDDTPAS